MTVHNSSWIVFRDGKVVLESYGNWTVLKKALKEKHLDLRDCVVMHYEGAKQSFPGAVGEWEDGLPERVMQELAD